VGVGWSGLEGWKQLEIYVVTATPRPCLALPNCRSPAANQRTCVTKVPTVTRIFCLTDHTIYATLALHMAPLGTEEVCRLVGIHRATLERWLSSGRLRPPQPIKIGAKVFRFWTQRDIERVRRFKEKFYRKGRGRKPKPKVV